MHLDFQFSFFNSIDEAHVQTLMAPHLEPEGINKRVLNREEGPDPIPYQH